MRIILTLLSLLSLVDGKGGVGGGRGASGARGASVSSGARGASSASRGASASASRPSGSYSAPRVVNTPVRSPSRSSSFGSSALLGFGAGALAGSLTANRINNAYAPVVYGGNNYYWSRDVVPQDAPTVCSRPLTDIDVPALEEVMYEDGTRPSEFAWTCSSSEVCCDWSCCEDNGSPSFAVARRSALDPNDTADPTEDSSLTEPSTLASDSSTDTNNEEPPLEDEIAQDNSFDSDDFMYRGSIAGWIILGIAIAALILIVGCIGVVTVKRRRKAQQMRTRRVVQQSQIQDPWTPDLPPSHRSPPVFTSTIATQQGIPPSYSNIVHAAPMPKSTLPEKPPAYSTQ